MNTKKWGRRCMATCCVLAIFMAGCTATPAVPKAPELPVFPKLPDMAPATDTLAQAQSSSQSEPGFFSNMADKLLTATGFKNPEPPELPDMPDSALPDRRILWRVFASSSLNVSESGQSLGLLTRIYKLKSADAFLQAPYDTFGDASKEKVLFGDELVAVREVQLVPGQRYESIEKTSRDIRFIGIVALFRSPAAGKWRYAFGAVQAEKSGLVLGAYACAMSVQVGEPIGTLSSSTRSAAAPCP
jgi:type VI secretion system protein VasD